jgi:hypothetical protein
MVASRQVAKSLSQTISPLRSFHLKAFIPYPESDDADYYDDCPPQPLLGSDIKDANEKASWRLLDLSKQGVCGSLDFQHHDQALEFVEPESTEALENSQGSGENLLLDCNDDMVWHWVDGQKPLTWSKLKFHNLL